MALPTLGTALAVAANGGTPTIPSLVVADEPNPGIAIVLAFRRATTESVTTAPTRDSQVGALVGTDDSATNFGVRIYTIENANPGTADVVAGLSASRNHYMVAVPYTDLDPDNPFGTPVINAALSATIAALTADEEALSVPCVYYSTANAQSFTPTSPVNELASTDLRSNDIYGAAGERTGTGSTISEWGFSATPTAVFTVAIPVLGVSSGATPTSVAPDYGLLAGGTAVTITGTGFDATGGSAEGVTFGGVAATDVVFVNDTTITCTTPAHAVGDVDVVVTNGDASDGTLTDGFTYVVGPALSAATGTTNGSGVATTDLTSDVSGVRVLVRAYRGAVEVGRTTTLPS